MRFSELRNDTTTTMEHWNEIETVLEEEGVVKNWMSGLSINENLKCDLPF